MPSFETLACRMIGCIVASGGLREVRARALGGLSEDSQRGTTAYLRLDDFEVERGLAKDSTLDPKVSQLSNRKPKPWFRDLGLENVEVLLGLSEHSTLMSLKPKSATRNQKPLGS